jgi:hypothetical protein
MTPTWCTYQSIYWESRASTCFEHYLLILRRRCTNDIWYITCVCQLAVARLQWNCNRATASWHNTHTIYQVFCVAPPEDEQVVLETCRGPWFSINWTISASRWFHYADILHTYSSMKMEQTQCSYTLAFKLQKPVNHQEESIQQLPTVSLALTTVLASKLAHTLRPTYRYGISVINPLTPELNPSAQCCMTRFFTGDFASWPCISLIYAWKTNNCNNYSFSLLIMYGSSYMFRHYIVILRERS